MISPSIQRRIPDARVVDQWIAVACNEAEPILNRTRAARRALVAARAVASESTDDLRSPELLDRLLRAIDVLR
jgi:hypothetical protein